MEAFESPSGAESWRVSRFPAAQKTALVPVLPHKIRNCPFFFTVQKQIPYKSENADRAAAGGPEGRRHTGRHVPLAALRPGLSSSLALSLLFRTRITSCYAYRVETGPHFVPG